MPEEHHGSTWVARETSRFIEANQNRPWFAWASWIAPHPPANVPDSFANLYAKTALPAVRGLQGEERLEARRFRELYYAAISLVDKGVGMVLDKLDELGLSDNTLVIYTSDHGEMLGDLGLMQKQLPYDGSVRVPFIVRFPSCIKANTTSDAFVDLNDILPTALDAAGIDVATIAEQHGLKHGFPGSSVLTDHGGRDRSLQYAEFGNLVEPLASRWIMLRDARWKYIYWFGDNGLEELFDLESDPHEYNNLASSPLGEAQRALLRLRKLALRHERRWGLPKAVCGNAFKRLPYSAGKDRYRKTTPEWSLRQWPNFVYPYTSAHLQCIERELTHVVMEEPMGAAARVHLLESERTECWREWQQHGGNNASFQRLFDAPKKSSKKTP
jgi:hypothetical protein